MKRDGGLRGLFRQYLPEFHWTTIETGSVEGGVPDMNGCFNGIELWCEMKLATGYAVEIRPQQVGWMLRRVRCGGRVFIAVRQRRKREDNLFLFSGAQVEELKAHGVRASSLGLWHVGPARWAWPEVKTALLTPLG
jgi:hypothetical protein